MKPEELICKAQRKDNGEWIEGFYFCLHHNDGRTHLHHFIIPLEADLSRGTPLDQIQVEVVPESITLKAQEPRVMTLEEVPKYDGAFLIEYRHEVWPMQWTLFRLELTIAYRFIRADYELGFSLTKDSYGRTWRCWTKLPTDEQREATPWND